MMGFAKGSTHPTGLRVQRAPGIPHALKGGEKIHARLGRFAPRDLYACLEIVIASGAKQSILSLRGKMDCFAPLAMTAPARICATRWFGMAALWPKAFLASNQLGCEFALRTATDIRCYDRYINPARHHVRAFGVGWESKNDGIDTIKRRP